MENASGCPRWSTTIYGTSLYELDTTRRTLKSKATSSLATRNIIANTYGQKASTIAGTSNLNKETKTIETNSNNMELLPVEENLLLNQDNIGEENTDNNMKAINNTKKMIKQNIANTETDDNESVNSEDSFSSVHEEWRKKINLQKYKVWIKTGEVYRKNLKDKIDMIANLLNKNEINIITIKTEKNLEDKKLYVVIYLEKKEDMEKACKLKIEGTQLNDRIKFWEISIGIQEQEFKSIIKIKLGNVTPCSMSTRGLWSSAIIAGEYGVKIVNTVLKICHRCYVEDYPVINCPVAKKQREISERKVRDFENHGQLYKRQRPQLYKSIMGVINMVTSYSDAFKNNINRKVKNNIIKKNDTTNENIMNMLLEIWQDIKEIKKQVKDIDERLELVETYCAYEILNNEEVEISDDENEEMNEKEIKGTNN
ncbi:11327_t:CDS:2 [Diversispora eburnea]|uniref:11327_t:CDS:1 n=1 Tax=Diversispora eburnea TaxID=1213867 RepID=A0A9N8VLG1_9GLOM|nr:11327_t:CDS:2 [Diversispora eburnea]